MGSIPILHQKWGSKKKRGTINVLSSYKARMGLYVSGG